MLRVTVLAIALTAVLGDGDNMKKCGKMMHPHTMHCCKNAMPPPPPETFKEDMKECFEIPRVHHTCDRDICIGKKLGFVSDNGTVDMKAWEKHVTEDFKESPTLVETIKENCIKGDVSKFGPPDACQIRQLKVCTHWAMALDCKEWDNSGPCAGIKDLAMECAKMFE